MRALAAAAAAAAVIALGCASGSARSSDDEGGHSDAAGPSDAAAGDAGAGARDGDARGDGATLATIDGSAGRDGSLDAPSAVDAPGDMPSPSPDAGVSPDPDAAPEPPDAGGCTTTTTQLLANPSFDEGDEGWEAEDFAYLGQTPDGGSLMPQSGDYYASLSGFPGSEPTIWQSVSVPAASTALDLSFYYAIEKPFFDSNDDLTVQILDAGGSVLATVTTIYGDDGDGSPSWTYASAILPSTWAGSTIRVRFRADIDGSIVTLTSFYVDTVALTATICE